jgi:hypothetical protein
MAFNFLFAVTTIPGVLLLLYALLTRQIVLAMVGAAALAVWPFSTFGLFHAASQVVMREPIHLRTFFAGGRRRLGLAYRWGALNLVVFGILAVNALFYLDPQAPLYGSWLGSFLGAFFLLACLLWLGCQACLLGVQAVLEVDSLRSSWGELRVLILRRPALVLAIGALSLGLFVAGLVVLPLGLLLGFASIAVLGCRAALDLSDGRRATTPRFSAQGEGPPR